MNEFSVLCEMRGFVFSITVTTSSKSDSIFQSQKNISLYQAQWIDAAVLSTTIILMRIGTPG